MNYVEYNIVIDPLDNNISEIIVAVLADSGFESFVETETGLLAYVPENLHKVSTVEKAISKVRTRSDISYSYKRIVQQNWNTIWESNFEPIFINNTIAVWAPFHEKKEKYKYEIIIEPKMSFGTGHHETTSLVMSQMLNIDFYNKTILDMGCGTGILAILAHKLGATDITAIDNDEWAFENSKENIEKNNCTSITVLLGDVTAIPQKQFDIILANINRNILLDDISKYSSVLKNQGELLLSGIYSEDLQAIETECKKNDLTIQNHLEKNKWVCGLFIKG
jgi:ribosomal protein L11 methyltransferase